MLSASARWSKAPFLKPLRPSWATVLSSGRSSSAASSIGSDSSRRMRTLGQEVASQLERRYGLFTRHRREGAQEILETVPCLQVVDEVLDRNARSHEYRCAAHRLGIAVND